MNLLKPETAFKILQKSRDVGADFCDIFVEKLESNIVSLKSNKIDSVQSGVSFGIGIRLVYGDHYLYSYSNSDQADELIKLVETLSLGQSIRQKQNDLNFKTFQIQHYKNIGSYKSFENQFVSSIDYLQSMNQKLRNASDKVKQVGVNSIFKNQKIEIFNSEGLNAFEERPYVRLIHELVVSDGSKDISVGHHPGARGGIEFIQNENQDKTVELLTKRALTMLQADPCPAGSMPVVINRGFGGVIFHEACGHSLETTSVQKKASVFWDKKGEKIAHENLSAVDDGTNDRLWGSISIDDEGMPTQKTQLIKNGVLVNFISDRMGEIKTQHPRTGSARRMNYKFAPASRMRNTYIEPGKFSEEEILSSVKDGLYAKAMGGGSVNPATGEFNFAVEEGYLIKNGKIDKPVRGATLIGKGEEILQRISMVGSNLEYCAGMCGSVSGSVPVTVGQPSVKVDEILVGGKNV